MKIKGTGEMGHTGLMTDSGMRISGESDTRRRLTAIYDYFPTGVPGDLAVAVNFQESGIPAASKDSDTRYRLVPQAQET